ncbi:glycosyltransferase [Acidihalobacter prosperus]
MTKVVMISSPVHTIPPRKGAAVEWWMLQVAQKLTNLDMHIIAIRGEDEPATEISDNITFHRIRIGKLYKRFFQKLTRLDPWSYSRRANFIINSIKPDIVHIHNNISLYKELITLNRDKNRKYILHMHNEKKPTDLPDFCNLFVVSAYLENWYRNRLPDANIQVIANGVDTDVFQPKWLDKETSVVKEINSAAISGKKVIMYVGRM